MGKLDEGKLNQFFLNQGLSTRRANDLAKKLSKEDVIEEEEKKIPKTMSKDVNEVIRKKDIS